MKQAANGPVYRHYIEGRTYKRKGPAGKAARWVVIDLAGQAVDVLEQINGAPGTGLFAREPGKPNFGRATTVLLNTLATAIDRRFGGRRGPGHPQARRRRLET